MCVCVCVWNCVKLSKMWWKQCKVVVHVFQLLLPLVICLVCNISFGSIMMLCLPMGVPKNWYPKVVSFLMHVAKLVNMQHVKCCCHKINNEFDDHDVALSAVQPFAPFHTSFSLLVWNEWLLTQCPFPPNMHLLILITIVQFRSELLLLLVLVCQWDQRFPSASGFQFFLLSSGCCLLYRFERGTRSVNMI